MFLLNVWLIKVLIVLLRIFKIGSGTSLPGYLIEKYNPKILSKIGKDLDSIILITGTNGKTTTRSLLASLFQAKKKPVCSNFGGANLIRGITTSLFDNYTWLGKTKSKVAILEVEEASLPILTKYLRADYLIFTNIFRDQLDVYGEIDKTQKYFVQTLVNLGFQPQIEIDLKTKPHSKLPKIIFNQEDPKLIELLNAFKIPELIGFTVDDENKLRYEGEKSGLSVNITKNIWVAKKVESGLNSLKFNIRINKTTHKMESKLSGVYNVYNILASVIVGWDFFGDEVFELTGSFEPVFGRSEIIAIGESQLQLFLVKNPAGFDEVLKLISQTTKVTKTNLCFLINDNIADGRDVSWLWDVDFENHLPRNKVDNLLAGGTRGLDLLLRLEYAGFKVDSRQYEADMKSLVNFLLESDANWQICTTYTAMLEIRKILASETKIKALHSKEF